MSGENNLGQKGLPWWLRHPWASAAGKGQANAWPVGVRKYRSPTPCQALISDDGKQTWSCQHEQGGWFDDRVPICICNNNNKCIYVYVYVCICVYVYVCICVYVYIIIMIILIIIMIIMIIMMIKMIKMIIIMIIMIIMIMIMIMNIYNYIIYICIRICTYSSHHIRYILFCQAFEAATPRQLWKTWGTKLTSLALDLGMLLGQAEVVSAGIVGWLQWLIHIAENWGLDRSLADEA